MALTVGSRLAHYDVTALIGEGGMGEVYQATDTTLNRQYVDEGVSGSTDHRPALDKLFQDARRRRFDVLVCWRLDRMGRNLKHLILFLEELQALGVDFVSLAEGIDATTPAGRLQMHIIGAIAEFERARIAERVRLGLARVQANGQKLRSPEGSTDGDAACGREGTQRRRGCGEARSLSLDALPEVVSKTCLRGQASSPRDARKA